MKQKQAYTKEFKLQLMELNEQGVSLAKLSREYGVTEQTLYNWKKHHKPETGFSESEEIKRLQKEIARLDLENRILKKATAIFAKDTK